MNSTLFFLRSSEQKIAYNMFPYALSIDNDTDIYTIAYGLKNTDLGVYSLTNNVVSGAAWIRLFNESHGAAAYVDNITPVLTLAILPDMRGNGIGTLIMNQLLQEAAVVYDKISVLSNNHSKSFYQQLGFFSLDDSDSKDVFIMVKKLEKKAIIRPTDGYDPRRWMD
ncbi:MAG: GNAT family N-acetyltransferase [Sulfuricurvum sp.]|nr:GNAT family N-acetyltransferase [Sulfuricurvum sp.]